ncbi:MAG TPA: lamin tail domain-containing protein [Phycisphaerae bacterium]|nr:lamin tail domain-containing protein [Phycisphaerae bacterium]HRW51489.1 lamin tail domain-containing protein [Phycisphaerae bacterium]
MRCQRFLACFLSIVGFAQLANAQILITEVMYDPNLGNEHEYVELYNAGPSAVDLTGYTLRDDPNQATPASATLSGGIIPPGETAVLIRIDASRTLANYQSAWGMDLNYIETPNWPVYSNGGDMVQLLDPSNTLVASLDYSPAGGFPFANDAASIYMLDRQAADPYGAANWALSVVDVDCARSGQAPRASDIGSPGLLPDSGCQVAGAPTLLITEVMYDPNLGNEYEYVELYNTGDVAVDLTGYTLRDNPAQEFPASATLAGGNVQPGETAILIRIDASRTLENYQLAWGTDLNFVEIPDWPVFSNAGDIVQLLDPTDTLIASLDYAPAGGFPFTNDSSSIYMLDRQAADPYAASNWALSAVGVDCGRSGSAPRNGDVGSPGALPDSDCQPAGESGLLLVTEIMYDPNLNNEHEYVEVYNPGTTPISLSGWKLRDNPAQAVPNEVTLTAGVVPAGGTAVLIRIDAARTLEGFRNTWGTNINFVEVTPWPVYTNGGDVVELLDPSDNVIASVDYTVTTGFPFPNDQSSIYMLDINALDLYGAANWALSFDGIDGAYQGLRLPAIDVGSPGFVPGAPIVGVCGDSNCDGLVNSDDIGFFIDAVIGGEPAWSGRFGGSAPCPFTNNDINADTIVNVGDLADFVAALLNGGCQ